MQRPAALCRSCSGCSEPAGVRFYNHDSICSLSPGSKAFSGIHVDIFGNSAGEEPMLTEVLIVGVMVGAIYSLVTIGYSMVYGILKLMNFAHGDVYIFGTLVCYTLLAKFHLNPFIAVLTAVAIGGLLASPVEIIAYRRLRAAQHRMISMITALGAAYVIQNSNELKWGNQVMAFPSILSAKTFQVFGLAVPMTQIIILGIAVGLIILFTLFLKYHPYGKAILCVSEDIPTASLMGIPINRTITMVYFIGGMLGVVGGILYSTSYNA